MGEGVIMDSGEYSFMITRAQHIVIKCDRKEIARIKEEIASDPDKYFSNIGFEVTITLTDPCRSI
jgi:hypothetical protein